MAEFDQYGRLKIITIGLNRYLVLPQHIPLLVHHMEDPIYGADSIAL